MTKAKSELPYGRHRLDWKSTPVENRGLGWKYSPAERRAIRENLPKHFDEENIYTAILKLEYSINKGTDYASNILVKEQEVRGDVVDHIRQLSEAKKFISQSRLGDYDFGGNLNEATAAVKKAERLGIEALELLLQEYRSLLVDLGARFSDIRKQYPLATDKRHRAFNERVLKAADDLWRSCYAPREPAMTKEYAAFLEATAKPVLTCVRFRKFGADWPKNVVRSHVDRLRRHRDEGGGVQNGGEL